MSKHQDRTRSKGRGPRRIGKRSPVARLVPKKQVPEDARSCGDCKACCVVMGVVDDSGEELVTEVYSPCAHMCGKGCAIYEAKPLTCSTYKCQWLGGFFERKNRPDRLGVIFDQSEPHLELPGLEDMQIVCAREVRPGAFKQPRCFRLVQRMIKAGSLIVFFNAKGAQEVYGREADRVRFVQVVRDQLVGRAASDMEVLLRSNRPRV